MTWRWDDAAYAAAEDHGQHVEGSLDSYDWDGFDAAGRVLLSAIDSVLELLPDYAGARRTRHNVNAGSSPADAPATNGCDDRDDWAVHQPGPAHAPIPGVHWYSGCDPDRPRVNPATGRCEGCGELACVECGRSNCPDHGPLVAA